MAASVAVQAVVGAYLTLSFLAGVIFNIFVIITFVRTRKLRCPTNYPVVLLAAVDLAACVLWLTVSLVVLATWEWTLTAGYCTFHSVISVFTYAFNIHTFVIIAAEKCLLITKPSKHDDVFNMTTMCVLMASLCVFDLVIALFPVMGWGKVEYSAYQFQCTQSYMQSVTHLNFITVVVVALPFLLCLILYLVIFARLALLRRRQVLGNQATLVLEEDRDVPWEAYALKLRKVERRIKQLNFQQTTPLLADSDTGSDPGYDSDHAVDDDETTVTDYKTPAKKRLYVIRRADLHMTLMMCAIWFLYSVCWLPTDVTAYLWALDWQNPPGNDIIMASAALAVLGLVVKPIFYVVNKDLRRAFKSALRPKQEFQESSTSRKQRKSPANDNDVAIPPGNKEMAS